MNCCASEIRIYTPTEYVLYKEQCTLYVVTHSNCVNKYIYQYQIVTE